MYYVACELGARLRRAVRSEAGYSSGQRPECADCSSRVCARGLHRPRSPLVQRGVSPVLACVRARKGQESGAGCARAPPHLASHPLALNRDCHTRSPPAARSQLAFLLIRLRFTPRDLPRRSSANDSDRGCCGALGLCADESPPDPLLHSTQARTPAALQRTSKCGVVSKSSFARNFAGQFGP